MTERPGREQAREGAPGDAGDERGSGALAPGGASNAPRALLAQLATAVRFLTIVPVPGPVAPIGESALFFPVVGLGLGAVLWLVDTALAGLVPPGARAVLLVATLAVLTGGLHLDGVADTADSLLAADRERALAIMRDTATGAFGVAALLLLLLLETESIAALPEGRRAMALLFAPMLGRWAMVALAFGSRPARGEGLGFAMTASLTFREFALASVVALGTTLAWAEARGLLVILVLGIVTMACRGLAHRKLGGITGDLLGALGELAETLALVVFLLGTHGGAR